MSIALVQKAGFTNNTATLVSLAFTSGNTLGNFLLALVSSIGGGYDVTSVSDTAGNNWRQAGRVNSTCSIWFAENCKAGANTVRLNKSGAVSRGFLAIAEYSGVAKTHALDMTSYGGGATSATGADSVKVANAGALMVLMHSGTSTSVNFSGVPTGWTLESSVTSQFVVWADNTSSVQGVNNFSVTASASDGWHEKMAVFLPAVQPTPSSGFNYVRTTESCNKTLSPSPGSPSSVAFPGGNNGGNLILVVTNQFFPATNQITGITDTIGNSYGSPIFTFRDSTLLTLTSVYACNGCIDTENANVLSAAFVSANVGDSVDIVGIEYSGQATGTLLDVSSQATASSGTTLSYSITPSNPNEMLFTVCYRNSGPNTWSGFGIETDRQPSKGNSNSETQMSDFLSAPKSANTVTVTNSATQLGSITLALLSSTSVSKSVSYTGSHRRFANKR